MIEKTKLVYRIASRLNKILIGPILRVFFVKSGLSKKFKFLNTNASSIGHLCIDVDFFIKESVVENFGFKGVLLASKTIVANESIARIWSHNAKIFVLKSRLLCFLLDYLRTYSDTSFDCSCYSAPASTASKIPEIYAKSFIYSPVATWPSELHAAGRVLFGRIFPQVDPNRFAVLHCRDSSFDIRTGNPNCFTAQHRNSDIQSYSDILKFLRNQGIFTIRVGEYDATDDSLIGLFYKIPPLSKAELDLLNAFIASECLLFLASNSGALAMAAIWNRPIFVLNVLPYCSLRQHLPNSMSVPKILLIDGRVLCAEEIFDSGYYRLNTDDQYKQSDIEIVYNRAEDCLVDFQEFFYAFVEGDLALQIELQESDEMRKYSFLAPNNCYDRHAAGLVPRHFFRKYDIV